MTRVRFWHVVLLAVCSLLSACGGRRSAPVVPPTPFSEEEAALRRAADAAAAELLVGAPTNSGVSGGIYVVIPSGQIIVVVPVR